MITLLHDDCLAVMRSMPDNAFDLSCVDPPYNLGSKLSVGGGSHTKAKIKFTQRYKENGKTWDVAPPPEYFSELFRVSRHQIIFGGNYYALPPTRGFIVWLKPEMVGMTTMSDCEFAWSSFDRPARCVPITRASTVPSIHPTQKPVDLYAWIFSRYAKSGDTILDTHLGSGSSAIAAHRMGFDFTGIEIDPEYYAEASRRLDDEQRKLTLFAPEAMRQLSTAEV